MAFNKLKESEKDLTFLMSQFSNQQKKMEGVDKTLIIFVVFEESQVPLLSTLHALPLNILDSSVKVKPVVESDPFTFQQIIYYTQPDKLVTDIEITTFKMKKEYENKIDENKNIKLFTKKINDQKIRIVTIPIEKQLFDQKGAFEMKRKNEEIAEIHYTKRSTLQGKKLEEEIERFKAQKYTLKLQFITNMRGKHLKMFNIQAIIDVLLKKTNKISICGIVTAASQRSFNQYAGELKSIMYLPQDANCSQFIVHSVHPQRVKQFQSKEEISSIWTLYNVGGVFQSSPHKLTALDDKYFSPAKGIRTNIYQMANRSENTWMAQVIEEFISTWNNLTFQSTTCIASVIKQIYLSLQMNGQLNPAFVELSQLKEEQIKSSKDLSKDISIAKFNTIFSKYENFKDIQLMNERNVERYFTRQKFLKEENIKIEKGETIVPISAERLVFLYYFDLQNKKFCDKYPEYEKKSFDEQLDFVFEHIKKTYELVNEINGTFLNEDKHQQNHCKSIKQYINFIDFQFKSIKLIKLITNKQFAICASIRVMFEKLRLKDNKLLEFILNHQNIIKEDEPIHYYDIILKIMNENKNSQENNIQYLYLHIHRLKADKIADKYINNKERLTAAVNSYAEIILDYDKIAESKKEKINKFNIEKKMARLLILIDLPDESLEIYKKNHLIKSVTKCFKQILMKLKGDDKCKKLIEFGDYLEQEYAFDLALDYYRIVYQKANTVALRRDAVRKQQECLGKWTADKPEQRLLFTRYMTGKSAQQEFVGSISTKHGQQSNEYQILFKKLKINLKWDIQQSRAKIVQLPAQQEPANILTGINP